MFQKASSLSFGYGGCGGGGGLIAPHYYLVWWWGCLPAKIQ
jgi:hypothetical protein